MPAAKAASDSESDGLASFMRLAEAIAMLRYNKDSLGLVPAYEMLSQYVSDSLSLAHRSTPGAQALQGLIAREM